MLEERRKAREERQRPQDEERRAKPEAPKGEEAKAVTDRPTIEWTPPGVVGKEPEEPAPAKPETPAVPEVQRAHEERAIRDATERAAMARLGQVRGARCLERRDGRGGESPGRGRAADPRRRGRQREAEKRMEQVGTETDEGVGEPVEAAQRLEGVEVGAMEKGRTELADELQQAEARLADRKQRTAEALERAAKRLEEAEARASEAEARAARAERLAKLKTEETEHERRLRRCSIGSRRPSNVPPRPSSGLAKR